MITAWGTLHLLWTILCYFIAKKLFVRTQKIYFSPIIVVPIFSIALILLMHHHFQDYYHYTKYLVAMLGPITVAFAIPIFRYRQMVRQHFNVLMLSSCMAMLVGVVSSWVLASLFGFDEIIKSNLLARSISIPFALILTEQVGGSISLIPLFTVITGLVGMLCGDLILFWMKFKNRISNGTAFGNGAHAMGIARTRQRHELEGVIASLSMIISGVIMVLFVPIVITFMEYLVKFDK